MKQTTDILTIAVIGAGYAARLHGDAYKRVYGASLRLKWIIDPDMERAEKLRASYGYQSAALDFEQVLNDSEVDVIDICTPPVCHRDMILAALKAGKHVICEKPLLGYFGEADDQEPVGLKVPKSKMYAKVLSDMEEMEQALEQSGKVFCYAENYVYSAAVQRAAQLIRHKKSKLLFLKGEESLKGSQARASGEWKNIGGGSLIRAGVHPLSSLLMLKQTEAKARGEVIGIASVTADTGTATRSLNKYDHRYIAADPTDVEDYASLSITFTDGTKAQVNASDLLLGGTRGFIEAYSSDGVLYGKISPVDIVKSYYLDEDGLEDVELSEMLLTKPGWNNPFVADETIRGFLGELQDFVECIQTGREPISNFALARDTMKVVYAAYQSAEEGRRIEFGQS